MQIRLGYVAIAKALENVTSSSLITYTHFNKLGKGGLDKLDRIIISNFEALEIILKYNIRNDIYFYRMTSNLIPLATHQNVRFKLNKYRPYFAKIGNIIKQYNMRVDTHPNQFCVLNSIREEVVHASINILQMHKNMFDLMKYNGKIIIHIGSSNGGKKESMKRFIINFNKLEPSLQKMILLENDDKTFNVANTLSLCEKLNIPMVLDYHHHLCNNTGKKIEDYLERIFKTWGNNIPKMHFSSPKNKKNKRHHHDYIDSDKFIDFITKLKSMNHDVDIMLEAKMKDDALFRLIRQLKYKTSYKVLGSVIYLED